jgi:hypothetical protein
MNDPNLVVEKKNRRTYKKQEKKGTQKNVAVAAECRLATFFRGDIYLPTFVH